MSYCCSHCLGVCWLWFYCCLKVRWDRSLGQGLAHTTQHTLSIKHLENQGTQHSQNCTRKPNEESLAVHLKSSSHILRRRLQANNDKLSIETYYFILIHCNNDIDCDMGLKKIFEQSKSNSNSKCHVMQCKYMFPLVPGDYYFTQ